MKLYKFIILCGFVVLLSLGVTYYFCTSDKIGLFISCIGAFATFATLYLAFLIFRNYSATADIQKRQFDLVEEVLSFFVTKSFHVKTNSTYYYSYLNKERLDYLLKGLQLSEELNKPAIISMQFFEFLIDVSSKINHHLFPTNIKMKLLSNLSFSLSQTKPEDAIIFNMGKENEEFGVPILGLNDALNTEQFILRMDTVRTILINYLNEKLHSTYKINV
jgi:hypothetical protein